MDYNQVGHILREYREQFNISREDLCDDICAVSTLLRIETGEEMPGQVILNQLFARMGLIAPPTSPYLEKKDIIRYEIERKIRILKEENEANHEIKNLLEEYKNCAEMDVIETQYYTHESALCLKNSGGNVNEYLDMLEKAVLLTVPAYKRNELPKRKFYSNVEFNILSEIPLALYDAGEKNAAYMYCEYLIDYFENGGLTKHLLYKRIPLLFENFAKWQFEKGEYELALKTCEKGMDYFSQFDYLFSFMRLLELRAKCLEKLGKFEESKKYAAGAQILQKYIAAYRQG